MEFSAYVINAISAVIAVEYIDYGFPKKYNGFRRWGAFTVGCVAYFLTVTALNRLIDFEGVLGFFYGAVLIAYGMWALRGRFKDFLVSGLLWVLIAMLGTYGIFSAMGLLTGNSLGEMLQLQGDRRIYASVVALAVKFSMGKIAAVFFRRQDGVYEKENGIVAGAFVFMTLLAMGLFWLEAGNLESSVRYVLTIGILLDEAGIIVFLVQLYQRLGRYQKEKIEDRYRREREQERLEGLMDMYRVGREINHWRHDMQGELDILYRMQKNGKYAEVETYMEKLCSGLRDYPELPQPTGNEGMDAALIKMIPKCRERGIHFCYVIMGKPERIDSMALGNILDNLLCNGMEACQNLGGSREIELTVRCRMDGLEIYLENSIGESVLEKNPRFVSHKREKERHGFGMESICRIVEEHEGTYEYWEEKDEENGRFCQRIYLNYV
ncbi:MAG: ATP-binding protein [Lachnospiraceae bacterium]|nr:ATP-binding protein [Lachnospiraceae bacterium]MBD5541953.1 ATP-binding protein [Lachnospiraceae bacterium]